MPLCSALQILVGTPGRLLDHIQTNPDVRRQLQDLKVLVLDEADQLLDMGFRKSLDGILKALPKERQTLLFSATVPNEVLLCVPSCHAFLLRLFSFFLTLLYFHMN